MEFGFLSQKPQQIKKIQRDRRFNSKNPPLATPQNIALYRFENVFCLKT